MVAERPDGNPHLAGTICFSGITCQSSIPFGRNQRPMSVLWQYYLGIVVGTLVVPPSALLFRGKLQRRFARHDDLDFRSCARFGFQIDPAT
jgi:hypothetical protein